jgi:hypothetical protein
LRLWLRSTFVSAAAAGFSSPERSNLIPFPAALPVKTPRQQITTMAITCDATWGPVPLRSDRKSLAEGNRVDAAV